MKTFRDLMPITLSLFLLSCSCTRAAVLDPLDALRESRDDSVASQVDTADLEALFDRAETALAHLVTAVSNSPEAAGLGYAWRPFMDMTRIYLLRAHYLGRHDQGIDRLVEDDRLGQLPYPMYVLYLREHPEARERLFAPMAKIFAGMQQRMDQIRSFWIYLAHPDGDEDLMLRRYFEATFVKDYGYPQPWRGLNAVGNEFGFRRYLPGLTEAVRKLIDLMVESRGAEGLGIGEFAHKVATQGYPMSTMMDSLSQLEKTFSGSVYGEYYTLLCIGLLEMGDTDDMRRRMQGSRLSQECTAMVEAILSGTENERNPAADMTAYGEYSRFLRRRDLELAISQIRERIRNAQTEGDLWSVARRYASLMYYDESCSLVLFEKIRRVRPRLLPDMIADIDGLEVLISLKQAASWVGNPAPRRNRSASSNAAVGIDRGAYIDACLTIAALRVIIQKVLAAKYPALAAPLSVATKDTVPSVK
jgi:hypothetical protein